MGRTSDRCPIGCAALGELHSMRTMAALDAHSDAHSDAKVMATPDSRPSQTR